MNKIEESKGRAGRDFGVRKEGQTQSDTQSVSGKAARSTRRESLLR